MNDADSGKKKCNPLCVQVHIGWLNTMVANNYFVFFESTYLSSDYTVQQIKLQKRSTQP